MINLITICRQFGFSLALLGSAQMLAQTLPSSSFSGAYPAGSHFSSQTYFSPMHTPGWSTWGNHSFGMTGVHSPLPLPARNHSLNIDQLNRVRFHLDRDQAWRQDQWRQQRYIDESIRLLQEQQRYQQESLRQQLEWQRLSPRQP